MTFTSFAILAALLTVPGAQAAETCSHMGNVVCYFFFPSSILSCSLFVVLFTDPLLPKSLFWGTTAQSNATARPIGWRTSASAPNDTSGHGILAAHASTSPTLWAAFDCAGLGAVVSPRVTKSGPPSGSGGRPGSGGGGGTGGTNGIVNFF